MNELYRNAFVDRLQTALIGPGADLYGLDPTRELVSTPPLQLYYSGILFPSITRPRTEGEQAQLEQAPLKTDEADEPPVEDNQPEAGGVPKQPIGTAGYESGENATRDTGETNFFYPANMGLTCCVEPTTTAIKLYVEAAHYRNLTENWKDRSVKMDLVQYEAIMAHPHFPIVFKEALQVEPLSDTEGLVSMPGLPPKFTPTEARARLKGFRSHEGDKLPVAMKRFELLLSSRMYKRIPLSVHETVPLKNGVYDFFPTDSGGYRAQVHIRVITHNNRRYVKVLLANSAPAHPSKKMAFTSELFNEKALFQVVMRIESATICRYDNPLRDNPFDEEGGSIAYQYRAIQSFGIGHGCAVKWEQKQQPGWVATTYLPIADIPGTSNDFGPGQEHLREVARLRNLSVWSDWSQQMLCDKLAEFAAAYGGWIDNQRAIAQQEPAEYSRWSAPLLAGQSRNHDRLVANIALLRTDKRVYDCFQLANTAMYIQMIISQDGRFGKLEKEWADCKAHAANGGSLYNDLAFFQQYDEYAPNEHRKSGPLAYRPFQLAFLLLNLESTINPQSPDRTDTVDLLWFPTGGGKTEAYLALTAFTILWRRTQFTRPFDNCCEHDGVSVIMRYTLRLLTAQQFERASRLIVALEFMRRQQSKLPNAVELGESPISIGMWVGKKTTPNKLEDARELLGIGSDMFSHTLDAQVRQLNREKAETATRAYERSPFQVSACPWCGCRLITKNEAGEYRHGYSVDNKRFKVECRNKHCSFHHQPIPLDVVDESLYRQPPTLLFATVDKFAQLAHVPDSHVLFDSINCQQLPPDLIIQDELHLLNGPLGSIVGLFELIVEMLCSRDGRSPKLIASTATTRNTAYQISNLYGGRQVNVFPPPGLRQDDSYFSVTVSTTRRRHVGFMPTGKTNLDTQVKALLPNLLFSRALLYQQFGDTQALSNYWTLVSYYNSLKQVGKIYNKIGDEIYTELRRLHTYHGLPNSVLFNVQSLEYRTSELTSRVDSTKIKQTLSDLEQPLSLQTNDKGELRVGNNTVDLVLASNMFSVGIDIGRLNIMLMNGQPKNSAEYIQASSRVARQQEGLVINLLDANVAREKSYFENYIDFHQAYYQYVEPLTITPYTATTFRKVLRSVLVCYVRMIRKLPNDGDAHEFDGDIAPLLEFIEKRIGPNPEAYAEAKAELDGLVEDWLEQIRLRQDENDRLTYRDDLIQPTKKMDELWALMQSMREVDTTSLLSISFNPIATDDDTPQEQVQEAVA